MLNEQQELKYFGRERRKTKRKSVEINAFSVWPYAAVCGLMMVLSVFSKI